MGQVRRLSRRRAVQLGATSAALPLVHIRSAGAAGKLNVGFWDHWVPGGTEMIRKQVEERAIASEGFNLPPQISMSDFKVWEEVQPPKATVYNYPIRPWHNSKPSLSGYPAPPEIAVQIFNRAVIPTMWAKLYGGQTIKQAVDWASHELERFVR